MLAENDHKWKKYHIENNTVRQNPFMFYINKELETIKPKSILEIGCGLGNNLAKYIGKINHIAGIDVTDFAITKAKEYYPEINFTCKSVLDVREYADRFDVVFTCATLEHLPIERLQDALDIMKNLSNRYIICMEAYDKDFKERHINWHRGITFNTLNLTPRFKKIGLNIVKEFAIDDEYYFWMVRKD